MTHSLKNKKTAQKGRFSPWFHLISSPFELALKLLNAEDGMATCFTHPLLGDDFKGISKLSPTAWSLQNTGIENVSQSSFCIIILKLG